MESKNLNVIIRAINYMVAVTEWGGANSRFLGLVVVVVCTFQPSSSFNPGSLGLESSVLVSS